jgi:hypothetical protein
MRVVTSRSVRQTRSASAFPSRISLGETVAQTPASQSEVAAEPVACGRASAAATAKISRALSFRGSPRPRYAAFEKVRCRARIPLLSRVEEAPDPGASQPR